MAPAATADQAFQTQAENPEDVSWSRLNPAAATPESAAVAPANDANDPVDDIIVEAPTVLATPSVMAIGHHAEALAHVEIGHTKVPAGYTIQRADADEVFRTLVAEPKNARLANPGLEAEDVDTLIGVLCIVLAIMRRLDLGEIAINTG